MVVVIFCLKYSWFGCGVWNERNKHKKVDPHLTTLTVFISIERERQIEKKTATQPPREEMKHKQKMGAETTTQPPSEETGRVIKE